MLRNVPAEYLKYSATYPNQEVIGHALYDTLAYTTTVTTRLTFFTATRATIDLSNMEVAGQLASPKAFLIRAPRVYYKQLPESVNSPAATNPQTGAIDNIAQLINTGVFELTIGSKLYIQLPLWAIPSGGGVFGQLQVSNVLIGGGYADAGGAGVPDARNVYTLAKPVFIEPQMNFAVVLTWPAALTLTRTFNVCVALEGDLIRPVQ